MSATLLNILLTLVLGTTGVGQASPGVVPMPTTAVDYNPDPAIVEIVLVARPTLKQFSPDRRPTAVYAYNGTIPGPTIEANLGDTLIVHFYNFLPEPTTVHWHGVDVPANMDGSNISQGSVATGGYFRYEYKINNAQTSWYHPHLATNEQIERGLYGALIFRDPEEDERLGVPRDHEFIVFLDDIKLDDNDQIVDFAARTGNDIDPLKRADELLNAREGNVFLVNGQINPTFPVLSGEPYRFRFFNPSNGSNMRVSVPGHILHRIGGDQGLLDKAVSYTPIRQIPDGPGHHNTNGPRSNKQNCEAIPGGPGGVLDLARPDCTPAPRRPAHHKPIPHLTIISDPDPEAGILLTPSERADAVLVPSGNPGEALIIEWHDIHRGRHIVFPGNNGEVLFGHPLDDGKLPPVPIMKLQFGYSTPPIVKWTPPDQLRSIPTERIEVVLGETETIPIFFGHSLPDNQGQLMFFATVRQQDELMARVRAHLPAPVPMFQPLPFPMVTPADAPDLRVGDVRVWEVVNFTGGDHNFHSHGFPFQHIETERIDADFPSRNRIDRAVRLEWKDTIRVPRRPGFVRGHSYTIVRLAARFDDSRRPEQYRRTPEEMVAYDKVPVGDRSGGWVAHCHLLDHAARGMMTFFNLKMP